MTLLRMTAAVRSEILSGTGRSMDDFLGGPGIDGCKCEVNSCTARSTDLWEFSEDDVRNLCRVHHAMMVMEHEGDFRIPLRWHWDDRTQTLTPPQREVGSLYHELGTTVDGQWVGIITGKD